MRFRRLQAEVPAPLRLLHGAMTAALEAANDAARETLAVMLAETGELWVPLNAHAAAEAEAVAAVPRGPAHDTVMAAVDAARQFLLAADRAARLVEAEAATAEAAKAVGKAACDNLVEAWVQLDAHASAATGKAAAEAAAAAATAAEAALKKLLEGRDQLEECIFTSEGPVLPPDAAPRVRS